MIAYINNHLQKQEGKFHLKSEAFADAIISAIKDKKISLGDPLPSINDIIDELHLSRKTIYTGYSNLRELGIVGARERVGYYLASENTNRKLRILFIVSNLSPYLKELYDALSEKLEKTAKIELYSHSANPKTFRTILKDSIDHFDKIVVSGFRHPGFQQEVKKIPPEKLILFSRDGGYDKAENFFLQDFFQGTYNALLKEQESLTRYNTFFLLYNESDKNFPPGIIKASQKICKELGLEYFHVNSFKEIPDFRKSVFLVIDDCDLVGILELIEEKNLKLGKEAGIISYNETAIKRVIRQGITTISVDFSKLGEMIANSILLSEKRQVFLETKLIKRQSL